MRFVVYRMFEKGQALPREQAEATAVLGDLRWSSSPYTRGAKLAIVYRPGTLEELIPVMNRPDIDMERSYLKLVGSEIIIVGAKDAKNPKVQRYHQEWRCAAPVDVARLWDLPLITLDRLGRPMPDRVAARGAMPVIKLPVVEMVANRPGI